jgi:hypothetical protein
VTDDGDPQETVDLIGDDGIVGRVVVPRVWHLPTRPARGIDLRDRHGVVWSRQNDPDFVDLWRPNTKTLKVMRWSQLLDMRGPLTEVL